jgi:tRNA nucleotidyltransferase (CCA-adding enzyme)
VEIRIPEYVNEVLKRLRASGFEAFAVGGCVRDSLLGRVPDDWDICTSAHPEETKACFADVRTVDTGIRHGTVMVLMDGHPVEITTYRIDGPYKDSRHPESVTFTRDLTEDLARRDFTINAMAYDREAGLMDPFGGIRDLDDHVIRAVGDPRERFREDALRILRAVRFSAVLGFAVEEKTQRAADELAPTVRGIASERIQAELTKLLAGQDAAGTLIRERSVLEAGLARGIRPDGRLQALRFLKAGLPAALVVVFGDSAADAAGELKYDSATIEMTRKLSELEHRNTPAGETDLLFRLRDYGEEPVRASLQLKQALDRAAGNTGSAEERALRMLDRLLEQERCYRREDLNISGRDLIELGVPKGKGIGRILSTLLDEVIREEVPNDTEALRSRAQELLSDRKEK